MDFLIADTFTDSLAKLNGDEQNSVKTAAFDLQISLASIERPLELPYVRVYLAK